MGWVVGGDDWRVEALRVGREDRLWPGQAKEPRHEGCWPCWLAEFLPKDRCNQPPLGQVLGD